MVRIILPCVLLACMSALGASLHRPAVVSPAQLVGHLENPAINESSGMVASRFNTGILWIHNDSGNSPVLYAIDGTGRHRGAFTIAGAKNIDWEDMTAFRYQGVDYLLIADVGDNNAKRATCELYAVAEPKIVPADRNTPSQLPVVWQRRFRYEDGPRDCEAVAVDEKESKILLLSKRDKIPRLYLLPLWTESFSGIEIATNVARVTSIPPPTAADLKFRYGRFRSQPTAMDFSPKGTALVILTYKHAYYYPRSTDQRWTSILSQPPMTIRLPAEEKTDLRQREALCFNADGNAVYLTSEDALAPIYRVAITDSRCCAPN